MAKLAITRPTGLVAMLCLVSFLGLLFWGTWQTATTGHRVEFGWMIYALGIGTMVLGFVSREDAVAIGAVMGLNLLVILDIALRIGVLYPFAGGH